MNDLDIKWAERVKEKYPDSFKNKNVLELGSLDVNGNVWDLFENSSFTGVDWIKGKNVHVVSMAHQTKFQEGIFDAMISFNHLEHDPHWEKSLKHNLPALKDGSLILLRWATKSSQKHGPEFDPSHENGYYPIDIEEIEKFCSENNIRVEETEKEQNPYVGLMGSVVGFYEKP